MPLRLRAIQINLNHCVVAQAIFEQKRQQDGYNIAFISEYHRKLPSWEVALGGRAALWVEPGSFLFRLLLRSGTVTSSVRDFINNDREMASAVVGHCGLRDPTEGDLEGIFLIIWQNKWDASTKGRWTYRLIPSLATWLRGKHGGLSFHVTQALTGRGCFGGYPHRIGRESSPECWMCGAGVDDPYHTLFECSAWVALRQTNLPAEARDLDPPSLIRGAVHCSANWSRFVEYVTAVLVAKEYVERYRVRNGLRAA